MLVSVHGTSSSPLGVVPILYRNRSGVSSDQPGHEARTLAIHSMSCGIVCRAVCRVVYQALMDELAASSPAAHAWAARSTRRGALCCLGHHLSSCRLCATRRRSACTHALRDPCVQPRQLVLVVVFGNTSCTAHSTL